MPNRYIREDAIESEAVNRLGWQAEVFWRRLMNRVDDFGRFTADTDLLRASIFPRNLSKVSSADTGKLLLECENAGLVSTWADKATGKRILALHKWEKGRAKYSKYPDPPPEIAERLFASVSTCLHLKANAPDYDYDSDTDTDNEWGGLPEVLSTDQFKSAWLGYLAYRRESKLRKLKPMSISKQWEEMAAWGHTEAMEAIAQTIRKGWQGIFEPKGKQNGNISTGGKSRVAATYDPKGEVAAQY